MSKVYLTAKIQCPYCNGKMEVDLHGQSEELCETCAAILDFTGAGCEQPTPDSLRIMQDRHEQERLSERFDAVRNGDFDYPVEDE